MKVKSFLRSALAVTALMAWGVISMSFTTDDKPTSRVVEDGGTGPYKAIMKEEPTLDAHTIFVPQDLSVFGKNTSTIFRTTITASVILQATATSAH